MAKRLPEKLFHIKEAVKNGNYRYTIHGAEQRIARRLTKREVLETIDSGEIIEDYPDHHYGPVCLLLGKTRESKTLRILVSLQEVVDIVTVYEPSLDEWEEDLKTRRKNEK